jgi:hypothetical protein
MSALLPKADIHRGGRHVRFGPKADIAKSQDSEISCHFLSTEFETLIGCSAAILSTSRTRGHYLMQNPLEA